jgi:hypothetical protein
MRATPRTIALLAAGAFLFTLAVQAQDEDSPSLGDVARQSRAQRQQKDTQAKDSQPASAPAKDASANGTPAKDSSGKDAQGKDIQGKDAVAKDAPSPKPAKRVITNEELYDHISPSMTSVSGSEATSTVTAPPQAGGNKTSAEEWRSRIQTQKNSIAALKSDIDSLNDSIHYAPGNCVSGCVQWNEHQKEKQDQVESMRSQLAEQERHLEEMQDAARQQGYGSSVYDP